MNWTETNILITGASRGLGQSLSAALAARGAAVVMVARTAAPLLEAAAAITDTGGKAFPLVGDVGDKRTAYRLVGAARALVGELHVVIHNASTLGPIPLRPLLDTECEDLGDVLGVNLVGPFRLTKAVLGEMAVHQRGLVVFISSDAAVEAYATWGAYSVSKAAMDQLARVWAEETREFGVRMVSIDPGEMDTSMHAAAMPDADPRSLPSPDDVARIIIEMLDDPKLETQQRVKVAEWRHA